MYRIASLAAYDAPDMGSSIEYHKMVVALRKMKNGKAPGLNLITAELLKATIDEER